MYTKHKWISQSHYNFDYVTYLPKDYDETKKYPLVFFLHGAGEIGTDNASQLTNIKNMFSKKNWRNLL